VFESLLLPELMLLPLPVTDPDPDPDADPVTEPVAVGPAVIVPDCELIVEVGAEPELVEIAALPLLVLLSCRTTSVSISGRNLGHGHADVKVERKRNVEYSRKGCEVRIVFVDTKGTGLNVVIYSKPWDAVLLDSPVENSLRIPNDKSFRTTPPLETMVKSM